MVKAIVKDELFMRVPSTPATKADKGIAIDLMDTLAANQDRCVGMAANMIGVRKNIIAINVMGGIVVMMNPVIKKKSDPYEAVEGCLSLQGTRKTTRYQSIVVDYYTIDFKKQSMPLFGTTAQIVQHECDHLEGKVI